MKGRRKGEGKEKIKEETIIFKYKHNSESKNSVKSNRRKPPIIHVLMIF
jgi:hypothetical protein